MTRRAIASIGVAALVPAMFWIGGFDFDRRGGLALACLVGTLWTWVASLTCPFWPENWQSK